MVVLDTNIVIEHLRQRNLLIVLGIALTAILAVLVVVIILSQKQQVNTLPDSSQTSQTTSDSLKNNPWQAGCVGNERVDMTHLPMNIGDVGQILPLGTVVGGHVTPIDHLYFSPIEFNSPRDAYPVYAMANADIIEISVRRQVVGTGEERPPEYRIVMQHSCQTVSYFDLVTSLSQEILDQVPQLATRDHVGDIRIPIEAGQEIARIGGQTLDTAIYNMDLILPGFISPELYEAESWKIHTDDFYSYFSEALVEEMYTVTLRQEEPRSGKIDWDIPGKLIGNWFLEGTNGYEGIRDDKGAYWAGHLHIGYDAILSDNIWVSIGDYDGEALQFYVKGNSPAPEDVGVETGLVKYELTQRDNVNSIEEVLNYKRSENTVLGVILLQVLEDEKLKVEIFPGMTGNQVTGFSSDAVIYER